MVPLDRDGVIGIPALLGQDLAVKQLELGKLVLKAVGIAYIDHMTTEVGHNDDVVGVTHLVHRHQ